VRLLADRARSGGGDLALDESTAPFVAELCRRCGGLPLAIELAGAQLAAMSVPDLLDHLSEPAADGADLVRAIAASSYALLAPDEATVFRRLAVLDGTAGADPARADRARAAERGPLGPALALPPG
jgi:predicted ATPase